MSIPIVKSTGRITKTGKISIKSKNNNKNNNDLDLMINEPIASTSLIPPIKPVKPTSKKRGNSKKVPKKLGRPRKVVINQPELELEQEDDLEVNSTSLASTSKAIVNPSTKRKRPPPANISPSIEQQQQAQQYEQQQEQEINQSDLERGERELEELELERESRPGLKRIKLSEKRARANLRAKDRILKKEIIRPQIPALFFLKERLEEGVEGGESLEDDEESTAAIAAALERGLNPTLAGNLIPILENHKSFYLNAYSALNQELIKVQIEESVLRNIKLVVHSERQKIRSRATIAV